MTAGHREPLILTALLDPASQDRFDRERRAHFPAGINYLDAHVTLFHHLPGERAAELDATLAAACRGRQAAAFHTTGLRFLGRGTAYALAMPEIAALRAQLAGPWAAWLTPQDRQTWQPHVTIQNKVAAAEARRLYEHLQAAYSPQAGMVLGLQLWRYLGGPWGRLASYRFGG